MWIGGSIQNRRDVRTGIRRPDGGAVCTDPVRVCKSGEFYLEYGKVVVKLVRMCACVSAD